MKSVFASFSILLLSQSSEAFRSVGVSSSSLVRRSASRPTTSSSGRPLGTALFMANDEKYQNKIAEFLANFMSKDGGGVNGEQDPFAGIDFNTPKLSKKKSLDELAQVLDDELLDKEWFVTGKVNPIYFADNFKFKDPDVAVDGIEEYAKGVYKLFDQQTSRAEIISTVVNSTVPNTITCTWRLSGRVKIGPGLPIKPYICYTDFTVDPETGLIVFQEDRFDIPGWDILVSALFPFLIGIVTSKPADPVPPRSSSLKKDGVAQ